MYEIIPNIEQLGSFQKKNEDVKHCRELTEAMYQKVLYEYKNLKALRMMHVLSGDI